MEQVELEMPVDVATAWGVVGDFGGVGEFLPGLDSFSVDGDDRFIGMLGLTIKEHLVSRDEAAKSLTYSVVEGVPLESHSATMKVEEAPGGSKVVWEFEVVPAEMAPIFKDTYEKGLEALRAHFSG